MAGELITADWQLELQGLLTGAGCDIEFGAAGIEGLGNPPAKTADVELDGQDGSAGSPDSMGVRTLLVHYEIDLPTAAAAFDALAELNEAWEPVEEDVELHLRLPGWGHIWWDGRPREVDPGGMPLVRAGVIEVIARFDALSPRHQVVS